MEKLVVLLPVAGNVKDALLQEILAVIRREVSRFPLDLCFLLTVNDTGEEANAPKQKALELSRQHPDVQVYVVSGLEKSITDAGAGRYVYGYYKAATMGNYVIDIDSAGAHDPLVIGRFINELLSGKSAVFSTRFGVRGAKNLYPLQRRIASQVTTLLSNLILGAGTFYPDMASGYQGFRSQVLLEVFSVVPADQWITMSTTTAFVETELRSYVVWSLKTQGANLKALIAILPIVYGVNKKGVNFPASVGLKALKAFYLLMLRRNEYLTKCRNLKA